MSVCCRFSNSILSLDVRLCCYSSNASHTAAVLLPRARPRPPLSARMSVHTAAVLLPRPRPPLSTRMSVCCRFLNSTGNSGKESKPLEEMYVLDTNVASFILDGELWERSPATLIQPRCGTGCEACSLGS